MNIKINLTAILMLICCETQFVHASDSGSWLSFITPKNSSSNSKNTIIYIAAATAAIVTAIKIHSMAQQFLDQSAAKERELNEQLNNLKRAYEIDLESVKNESTVNAENQSKIQMAQQKEKEDALLELTRQSEELATVKNQLDASRAQKNAFEQQQINFETQIIELNKKIEFIKDKKTEEKSDFIDLKNQIINPFQYDAPDLPALYNASLLDFKERLDMKSNTISIDSPIQKNEFDFTTSRLQITPYEIESDNLIIIKVLHGTFAKNEVFSLDYATALENFAKQLAIASKSTVLFDIFKWNGGALPQDRQNAGIHLAQEIEADKNKNTHAIIWTIGHSHGCNVIYNAAHFLKEKQIMIDNAILLASPTEDAIAKDSKTPPLSPQPSPKNSNKNEVLALSADEPKINQSRNNIKSIINIWGAADPIVAMGSIISTIGTDRLTSKVRKSASPHSHEIVRNIILKHNGKDLNHDGIKVPAMQFMAAILQYIGNNFLIPTNIILNIYDNLKNRLNLSPSSNSASVSASTLTSFDDDNDDEDLDDEDDRISFENRSISSSPANIRFSENESPHLWVIEGVIDNAEPLRSLQYLQGSFNRSLKNSIKLSDINEINFAKRYSPYKKKISIHSKPHLIENLGSDLAARVSSVFLPK